MLIDHTHKKWMLTTVVVLAAATIVYVPYRLNSPRGPSGGSAIGLTFGIAGAALMIFAALLGARKRVPVWRVGRAQTWMRGHLWLGLLSLPLILFHAGFAMGGTLTSVLMVLMVLVVASGMFGALLQHYLPNVMTRQVPMETIYEEISNVRKQLLEEADKLVENCLEPSAAASLAAGPVLGAKPATVIARSLGQALSFVEHLQTFHKLEIRPFLDQSHAGNFLLSDAAQAHWRFEQLRTLLPPVFHETVRDLENLCEEARQLNRQERLQHLLHGWLLFHIPISYALLLLGAAHAIMALRY